ncbi:tripartite tricarboxylate transporter TctB family protein [Burkholderia sp. R-70199]|nr:tripartite tricarboxylate transporter TctB family protein [Burkholderia sp. R-70006]MBK5065605.1 tripartite tricarboxylate transporter TctB family protein [Burkholderia sp. R-70199]MBK5169780.1 tripartite tricarboxylate transporter TctB family protein [Burkholderia sp. R-70211]MBK5185245.1 tripartite tricarboxylate transporter TctB family protein [Burkholderia sp. R-69749]
MSEQRAGLLALSRYSRDYYGGGLMLLVGASAIYKGLDYQVGTLTRMGPGYFPVAVGSVLAAMGVLILLGARRQVPAGAAKRHAPEWRGWLCIILASIAFVVLGHYGGLVPATFGVVFIAALGDRQNSLRSALLLAVAMVAVSVIVFSWALQLQLPLFRWG